MRNVATATTAMSIKMLMDDDEACVYFVKQRIIKNVLFYRQKE